YLAQRRPQQRGLARAVRPGDRHPVRPVNLEVDRAERERAAPDDGGAQRGHDRTRPRRGRDLHPQLPLLARLLHGVKPLDQALGLAGLRRLLLGRFGAELPPDLVVVRLLAAGIPDPLLHPGALRPGPFLEPGAPGGVLVVGLALVPPGYLPFGQVGGVATAERPDLLLAEVELDHASHGPAQELPVVADHDHAGAQALNELL